MPDVAMMKKIEMVYAEILKRKVVNADDLNGIRSSIFEKPISYKYFYNQYLSKLLRENKLGRIRKGLYYGRDIYSDKKPVPDKYLISAKLRKNYYLGYHTALELHGCAYSNFNRCFTVIKSNSKFEPFSFDNVSFQEVLNKDISSFVEVIKYSGHNIRTSNPSRTFVECLDRPELCGGWEEILKSLESLGKVKINEILKLLMKYDKQVLYRKCGYILDIMMEHSPYYQHIKEQKGLPVIKNNDSELFIEKNKRGKYIPKWRLFIPFDFIELIKGV
jgi:predicted transcriptional regulator of viral defense system